MTSGLAAAEVSQAALQASAALDRMSREGNCRNTDCRHGGGDGNTDLGHDVLLVCRLVDLWLREEPPITAGARTFVCREIAG